MVAAAEKEASERGGRVDYEPARARVRACESERERETRELERDEGGKAVRAHSR